MKDELKDLTINDGCYIVNMQSSTQGDGTHWVCFKIKNKHCVYFDSFGAPPPIDIETFIKTRKNIKIGFNNWIIQDLKSTNCGWFCIGCLAMLKQNKNKDIYDAFDFYINNFSGKTKENDSILKSLFTTSKLNNRPITLKKFLK